MVPRTDVNVFEGFRPLFYRRPFNLDFSDIYVLDLDFAFWPELPPKLYYIHLSAFEETVMSLIIGNFDHSKLCVPDFFTEKFAYLIGILRGDKFF